MWQGLVAPKSPGDLRMINQEKTRRQTSEFFLLSVRFVKFPYLLLGGFGLAASGASPLSGVQIDVVAIAAFF
jgi:hypothetical protein